MKIRILPLILTSTAVCFVGLVVIAKMNQSPEPPRPGTEQSNQGREHVKSKKYGGDQPPTSGPHANPVAWGSYDVEVPDDQAIHNMEHGGIYVSYQPTLPKDQIEKLKELLSAPFSDAGFEPKKIVLAPRAANKFPIELSSWRRSETLANFNQAKIEDYVTKNLGKSPEPFAQ